MSVRKLNIPAFRNECARPGEEVLAGSGTVNLFNRIVVVRWGRVGGFTFRTGDRLILQHGSDECGLLLLRPKGYGWPMLGRRVGAQLIAEPGGVRAAPRRWQVAASVMGVERPLERSVTDRGHWWVVVEPRGATTVAELEEKGLRAGHCSSVEVDALCHRAARWMEQDLGAVAVGVAATESAARELAHACPAGRLRIGTEVSSVERLAEQPAGDLVMGPWAPLALAAAHVASSTESTGTRYDSPQQIPSDDVPAAQVPLFRRGRSHRAS